MLRWPVGSELVGLAAAGFIIGGLVLLLWGWLHQYEDELEGRAMSHPSFVVTRVAGIVGDSVRGLLLVLIGAYLMISAVTDNPAKVKGLDQALLSLAHQPLGVWLLSVATFGFFSFALYSGMEVRHRRA